MVGTPHHAIVVIALLVSLAWTPSLAVAALPSGSEREAAGTLREPGERDCVELSRRGFERLGEHVMIWMLVPTRAHGWIDDATGRMIGGRGKRRLHEFIGRGFAGCGGGLPAGAIDMMGAITRLMRGPAAVAPSGGGMTAGERRIDAARRARSRTSDGAYEWDRAATMVVTAAALVAVTAVAIGWLRRRQGAPVSGPLRAALVRHYAQAEIGGGEYRRRTTALGDGA